MSKGYECSENVYIIGKIKNLCIFDQGETLANLVLRFICLRCISPKILKDNK